MLTEALRHFRAEPAGRDVVASALVDHLRAAGIPILTPPVRAPDPDVAHVVTADGAWVLVHAGESTLDQHTLDEAHDWDHLVTVVPPAPDLAFAASDHPLARLDRRWAHAPLDGGPCRNAFAVADTIRGALQAATGLSLEGDLDAVLADIDRILDDLRAIGARPRGVVVGLVFVGVVAAARHLGLSTVVGVVSEKTLIGGPRLVGASGEINLRPLVVARLRGEGGPVGPELRRQLAAFTPAVGDVEVLAPPLADPEWDDCEPSDHEESESEEEDPSEDARAAVHAALDTFVVDPDLDAGTLADAVARHLDAAGVGEVERVDGRDRLPRLVVRGGDEDDPWVAAKILVVDGDVAAIRHAVARCLHHRIVLGPVDRVVSTTPPPPDVRVLCGGPGSEEWTLPQEGGFYDPARQPLRLACEFVPELRAGFSGERGRRLRGEPRDVLAAVDAILSDLRAVPPDVVRDADAIAPVRMLDALALMALDAARRLFDVGHDAFVTRDTGDNDRTLSLAGAGARVPVLAVGVQRVDVQLAVFRRYNYGAPHGVVLAVARAAAARGGSRG